MIRFPFLMSVVLITLVIGCGKPVAPAAPVASDPAPKPTATITATGVAPAGAAEEKTSELAVTPPEKGSAAEAFQKTLAAFQTGRIDTVYESLPAAHQTDVENIVRLFAEKMDAELWSKGFGLMAKAANVMREKKSMIFSMDLMKLVPQSDSLQQNWDSIVAGIQTVATSEVADLGSLKQADLKYLLSAGSDLIHGFPLPNFNDVSVTTIKSDGQTETISYRESKGSEPKEVEFVKIDGKWLPKSIATNWSASIDDLKGRLADFPERIKTVKPQVLKQLETFDESLGRLLGAKNRDEFTGFLMPLIFNLRFGAQMAQESWKESATRSRSGAAVRVEINRALDDDVQTKLKDAIVAELGTPDVDYEMMANDGKTRCRFSPVDDAATLVTVLEKQFDGATVRWNSETKTIYVELK